MQNGTNMINGDVSYSNKVDETINSIFSFKNLYKAYEDCTKGVKWKYSTQHFMTNACCRVARIRKSILNETYKNGIPRFFKISERGKVRHISALPFQDRVVHKCLCDNYLTPLLRKSMIHDSGATLKGKGLSFTRKRILKHLSESKPTDYVLKIDLHNYFESISHKTLFEKFSQIMPTSVLCLLKYLIPERIKGLGLGSQISQISAFYYLNDIDHIIKEDFKIKRYGRYMDDFYLVHHSKEKLKHCLRIIEDLLFDLNIEINKKKTHIYQLKNGFVFCKIRYFMTKRFVTGHSIRSFNKKLKLGYDVKASLYSYLLNFNCGVQYFRKE